jgi:hypothetical protein
MDFNAEKAVGLVRTLFNTPAVDYHVYTRWHMCSKSTFSLVQV